ncbi:class F sortase [Geodermatophilus poikilotrophus]|uniref:Sortase (Surface protein transpeptidase) n=1 Tax=Geodermatophilus poikilotrophus TaxID=1333667 RepID=A0A1H9Z1Q2_9ACTN|nr:class F sortase [Geodermatophilus poikilotrophus]SES75278.1 Sortase (surface protein transpeptidase) [Geodermatophilus poikilotrophus]
MRGDRRRVALVVGAVLAGIGLVLLLLGVRAPASSPAPEPARAAPSLPVDITPDATSTPRLRPPVDALPRSVPVRLDIPRIGVHTELIALGLNPDGTVAVPPLDPGSPAGWYQYLASPGEPGPAVLLGHVDSHRGPAVFHRLPDLAPSDAVVVRRADGRSVVFAVESVHTYPKTAFPTEAVYGTSGDPVLRLVTCGGVFDRAQRAYLANVVVYARFVGWSR